MKSKAICILGMHRSGTSAIARSINFLGAYLGENSDFLTPFSDNPEGYWERDDIVSLNDRILYHLKKTWDTTLPLPDRWHVSDKIKPFKEEIITLIKKTFSDHQLWAFKDPRISILFPLWRDVLNELGIEFSTIFVIRNPLDVAKSLKIRDGFSYDKSFGIWFHYNIAALISVFDLPHVFIHYDRVIDNWELELRKCASSLIISWPDDISQFRGKMNKFVRPELRHSLSGIGALKRANAPKTVIDLFDLLIRVSRSSISDKEFNIKIRRLSSDFLSYTVFFQYDMGQQLLERDRLIAQIDSLLNSYSWRITAPLRKLRRLYKRTLGAGINY